MKTNCPNCGAPIKHYYNHNCPYCGTFLHNTDEQLDKFEDIEKNYDIYDEEVIVERRATHFDYEVFIKAKILPKVHWFREIDESCIHISSTEMPINKFIATKFMIPYEYYKVHDDVLQNYIYENIPPIFNRKKLEMIIMCYLRDIVRY